MSRLILGVLASVAEFERDLIRERTRLGMAKARQGGKRIGRPRVARPDAATVARLRTQGRSWREIAADLGCSTWAARRLRHDGGADHPERFRGRPWCRNES